MTQIKVINNLIQKKFNRLLVISRADDIIYKNGKYTKSAWNCLCDCGKEVILTGETIQRGNTKSCGCLKSELLKINNLDNDYGRKYSPIIGTAKVIYKGHYNKDDISFDDFYKLSQMNCVYCNSKPSNKCLIFKNKDSIFIYNGLDRIDNSKSHTLNNVITSCKYCNFAKRERSLSEYCKYILRFINKKYINIDQYRDSYKNIEMCDINKKYFGVSVKAVYGSYKDGDLTVEQFYKLSQLSCYYCDIVPSNKTNRSDKDNIYFLYNGLDRIDSNLPHNYNNIITCCKYCNYAKRERSFDEFMIWIDKLKNNYNNLLLSIEKK